MAEKEPISTPRHIEEAAYICLPEFAIEQKERISQLEHKLELVEANKGALNSASIRTVVTIVAFMVSVGSTIAAMWLATSTEPTRTKLDLLAAQVEQIDSDLVKDEIEISALESEVDVLLTETLRTEDVTSRLDGVKLEIRQLDGKFSRPVTGRLEPRIDRDEKELAEVVRRLNKHLEKP